MSKSGMTIISGMIGLGSCQELVAWIVDQDLPDPKEVLFGRAVLPERADRQRAAAESIISYAVHYNVDQDKVWKILAKTRKDVRLALGILYINVAEAAGKVVEPGKGFEDMVELLRGAAVKAKARVIFQRG